MVNLKTPFFTRKNILVISGVVLMLYLLLWGSTLIRDKADHSRALQAVKAREDRIKNLSREEQTILKAKSYLVNSINLADTSERLFLSYLQRKFDLPAILGIEGPVIDLYEDPATYPADIHYLAR